MKKLVMIVCIILLGGIIACSKKRTTELQAANMSSIVNTVEEAMNPEVVSKGCYSADTLGTIYNLNYSVTEDDAVKGTFTICTMEKDSIKGTFEGARLDTTIKGIYSYTEAGTPVSFPILIEVNNTDAAVMVTNSEQDYLNYRLTKDICD
ncbi:hypothetical protein [Neptunitalea lumnitzerae]|uniref:Lipocalin-like domain-containing protein n=1 Tax=Neptunitalea lumnitzerae TaxID=2965509 RepID=A0ABQ5MFS0_9FLAO|nr:hypothetical protein [Neptunitalea sp. Y10]GLB48255.1 hypothetical protein Y10_06230 [Neptunitalea sp. Y10]